MTKHKLTANRTGSSRNLRVLAALCQIIAVAALLFGLSFAAYEWYGNYRAEQWANKLLAAANSGQSTAVPSTNKPSPSDFTSYHVAGDAPRYLFIDKINVGAIVRPLGVTSTGELATPSNVFDAGWYTGSSRPGKLGVTLIDGHVSSWTTHGVFYNLKSLIPGDHIHIELGNGTEIQYSVVRTKIYDHRSVDMSAVLAPVNPKKPGLNLITCTGDVIKGTNEFNQRIVVFAQQDS